MFVRSLAIVLLCTSLAVAEYPLESDKGVVRDEKCAVSVGVAILSSVYGEERVRKARFRAELVDGEWRVSEDFPPPNPAEVMFGGGFYITLAQKDGRVLSIGFNE